jgi:hypothetical protein
VNSSFWLTNVFDNLYLNVTKPNLLDVAGSMQRNWGALKHYSIATKQGYEINLGTNVVVSDLKYVNETTGGSLVFTGFAPSGQTGSLDIAIPRFFDKNAFSPLVNGSQLNGIIQDEADGFTHLKLSLPSGSSLVRIKLEFSSSSISTVTSTTPSTQSTTGGTPPTESSRTSTTSSSTSNQGFGQLQYVIVGAVVAIVGIVSMAVFLRSRVKRK